MIKGLDSEEIRTFKRAKYDIHWNIKGYNTALSVHDWRYLAHRQHVRGIKDRNFRMATAKGFCEPGLWTPVMLGEHK